VGARQSFCEDRDCVVSLAMTSFIAAFVIMPIVIANEVKQSHNLLIIIEIAASFPPSR